MPLSFSYIYELENLTIKIWTLLNLVLLIQGRKTCREKGALKQGPCTCSTFKVFDLKCLHVLHSLRYLLGIKFETSRRLFYTH